MKIKLILLGTGTSSGVPSLKCLLNDKCKVCMSSNPKNIRTNTSILIATSNSDIIIDCTKHFYSQYLRYLKKYNSNKLPKILLTHEHADAINGLDFIRKIIPLNGFIDLYAEKRTISHLLKHFGQFFFRKKISKKYYKPEKIEVNEQIKVKEISENQLPMIGYLNINKMKKKMTIDGIYIETFNVEHGDITCTIFLIENKILYISDCSKFDLEIQNIQILIVECNTWNECVKGHLNYENVKQIIKKLKPKRVILTGMSHKIDYKCGIIDHFQGADIELGYDMMEIEL